MVGRLLTWSPALGGKSITDYEGIQNVWEELREARLRGDFGNGPITKWFANRELAAFRAMFKWARDWRRLPVHPFQGFKSLKEEDHRERILKPGEELKLYKAIEAQCRTKLLNLRWLSLAGLVLSTLLRRGVLLNLKCLAGFLSPRTESVPEILQ